VSTVAKVMQGVELTSMGGLKHLGKDIKNFLAHHHKFGLCKLQVGLVSNSGGSVVRKFKQNIVR
jgi:hypothetical protein